MNGILDKARLGCQAQSKIDDEDEDDDEYDCSDTDECEERGWRPQRWLDHSINR